MSGWPAEDISRMRADRVAYLSDVCDIDRPTFTKNEILESVEDFALVATEQPCRVRILRGTERSEALRNGVQIDAVFTCGLDIDVRQGDRIHALGAYWRLFYLPPVSSLSLVYRGELTLFKPKEEDL